MRARRRHRGMEVNGEINVVSLIDVMMLLMVIFMITAPMMQSGLDVELPKADAPAMDAQKSVMMVQVKRDGKVSVDGTTLTVQEFSTRFKALAARKGKDVTVALQGDQAVPYGRVVELFAMMMNAGITNISMVTEPLDSEGR
ncbi:MAG: ExbD/TolR family protein [Gemmatimonas sp.]|jgi:biopolymer transport protein TolR